jgi:hypothetical protein
MLADATGRVYWYFNGLPKASDNGRDQLPWLKAVMLLG